MNNQEDYLIEIRGLILTEIKAIKEIVSLSAAMGGAGSLDEQRMANLQIKSLKNKLRKTIDEISGILDDMSIIKPLPSSKMNYPGESSVVKTPPALNQQVYPEYSQKNAVRPKHEEIDKDITFLEKKTLKRLKKKKPEKISEKKRKPSKYVGLANRMFGGWAQSFSKTQMFATLKRDLIKANMNFIPTSYAAVIFLTTTIFAIVGFFIFVFFMLFDVHTKIPIITSVTENLLGRFSKVFWILIVAPLATFLTMYIYPSAEKSYIENKINQELPFATIHMSAISGSMVEPSKIFNILISTKDYPFLQKEFIKVINEVNVYGYDIVNALRNVAFNSPSMKLTELLNGFATTITSGGSLQDFFEKRAQTLLFDYQIEREKYTKSAETFMDIYISIVIATPMILMLLLIMMEVSGLGVSLSISMITLIMVLGVTIINILFLAFLQLKQPSS